MASVEAQSGNVSVEFIISPHAKHTDTRVKLMPDILKTIGVSIALFGSTFSTICAEPEKGAALPTRVFLNIPASIVWSKNSEDSEKRLFKPLPDLTEGRKRYDAIGYLVENGVRANGSIIAVYLPDTEALVVKGSPDVLEQAEGALDFVRFLKPSVKMLQINVSAWTYLDDPQSVLNHQPPRFDQIQKVAGNTLRPIDAHLLTTHSGSQISSSQVLSGTKDLTKTTPDDSSSELKTPGSFVQIEPTIGPDGSKIDFFLRYKARIPQSDAPDLCLSHETVGTIVSNTKLVVHQFLLPPIENQDPNKIRKFAVVLSTGIFFENGDLDTPELHAEHKRRLIEDAFKDLPSETR